MTWPASRIAIAAAALALGLALTGCTSADDNEPSTNPSSSPPAQGPASPSAASLPGKDVSAELLDAASWGTPIATIERPAEGNVGTQTANVYSVKTGPTGTVLRWTTTAASGLPVGTSGREWQDLPVLVDPATRIGYRVSTFDFPGEEETYCLCAGHLLLDEAPSPSSAYYAPLPEDVTEVTLTWAGWPDTTVPVTREDTH